MAALLLGDWRVPATACSGVVAGLVGLADGALWLVAVGLVLAAVGAVLGAQSMHQPALAPEVQTARGWDGQVVLEVEDVLVCRGGPLARLLRRQAAPVRVPLSCLTSVVLTEQGWRSGHLRLLAGTTAQLRPALLDPTAVLFHGHRQAEFRRLAAAVSSRTGLPVTAAVSHPRPVRPQPTPVAAAPVPAAGGSDVLAQLERLDLLRTRGLVTDGEFAAGKAELLSRL